MRIGVDGSCWANGRGYGRYTRELLRAMVRAAPDDEFVCFLDPAARRQFDLSGERVRAVGVATREAPTAAASADGARGPLDMLRFTRAVWREPLDVFFSPSVYTYFPLPPLLPAVVTIHDAIAERFPELTLPTARARLFWRAKVGLALLQARLVLTVSDYAARELMEVLSVPRAALRVGVEAPAADFQPGTEAESRAAARRAGVTEDARWFCYVGGFGPHKRVDAIVRAHGVLARELGGSAPHLLLVGVTAGDAFLVDRVAIERAIDAAGTASLVHWTGFVADSELRHLHSGAVALLLPSMAEGFGLPAVEAAACGCPVIATTASPLPELLKGGGLFVAPGDDAALLSAMRRLANDEPTRQDMGERALAGARALTWDRAASAALGALREVAA